MNSDELKKLEKEHKNSIKMTDIDVVEAFPEESGLVVQKLNEYWKEAVKIYPDIKFLKKIADRNEKTSTERWVFANARKYEKVGRLAWLHDQIRKLERLKVIYEKKRIEKSLSKEYFKTKEEKKKFDIDSLFDRQDLLIDLMTYYGQSFKGATSCFVTLCCFHSEKTPSLAVYHDNWYHCFGCQKHGNFIDYLMEVHHMTFREALEEANRFL